VAPVQFGTNFGADQTLTPQNFSTTAYDNQIPSSNATVTTSGGTTNISGGTLTASMANGGTATEHSPYDATSGWQATYSRPVFQNINFTNVRIPKGLNAKFINCTFNGYTSVSSYEHHPAGHEHYHAGSVAGDGLGPANDVRVVQRQHHADQQQFGGVHQRQQPAFQRLHV